MIRVLLINQNRIPHLNKRIDDIEIVGKEVLAWQGVRNNKNAKINWQITTENARIRLYMMYPTLES